MTLARRLKIVFKSTSSKLVMPAHLSRRQWLQDDVKNNKLNLMDNFWICLQLAIDNVSRIHPMGRGPQPMAHWGDTGLVRGSAPSGSAHRRGLQSVPSVAQLTEHLHVIPDALNVSCSSFDGDVKAYSVNNTMTGFEVKWHILQEPRKTGDARLHEASIPQSFGVFDENHADWSCSRFSASSLPTPRQATFSLSVTHSEVARTKVHTVFSGEHGDLAAGCPSNCTTVTTTTPLQLANTMGRQSALLATQAETLILGKLARCPLPGPRFTLNSTNSPKCCLSYGILGLDHPEQLLV